MNPQNTIADGFAHGFSLVQGTLDRRAQQGFCRSDLPALGRQAAFRPADRARAGEQGVRSAGRVRLFADPARLCRRRAVRHLAIRAGQRTPSRRPYRSQRRSRADIVARGPRAAAGGGCRRRPLAAGRTGRGALRERRRARHDPPSPPVVRGPGRPACPAARRPQAGDRPVALLVLCRCAARRIRSGARHGGILATHGGIAAPGRRSGARQHRLQG